jgi:hypothetical protein
VPACFCVCLCLPVFAFACACLRLLLLVPACFCLCLPVLLVPACLTCAFVYVCVRACHGCFGGGGSAHAPQAPRPPWDPGTQGCGRRNNRGFMCVLRLCVCVGVCPILRGEVVPWSGEYERNLGSFACMRVCDCVCVCVCVSVCVYVCVGSCLNRRRQRTEPLSYQRVFLRTRLSSRHFYEVSPPPEGPKQIKRFNINSDRYCF